MNTPGVVNVTSGPGGINALIGVYGAWTDSIPILVTSTLHQQSNAGKFAFWIYPIS